MIGLEDPHALFLPKTVGCFVVTVFLAALLLYLQGNSTTGCTLAPTRRGEAEGHGTLCMKAREKRDKVQQQHPLATHRRMGAGVCSECGVGVAASCAGEDMRKGRVLAEARWFTCDRRTG